MFQWFGDKIKAKINAIIDDKMHATGAAVVARAQALAPVDTGALRSSIQYVVATGEGGARSVLSIQVGMFYGIFQEFGTRNIPAHPYIRPALNEVGRIWGFDTQMFFAGAGYNPLTAGPWHGLIASTGLGKQAGFALSASPRAKPLTPKQIRHVRGRLIPGIKAHHRGNVKRSRMYVG